MSRQRTDVHDADIATIRRNSIRPIESLVLGVVFTVAVGVFGTYALFATDKFNVFTLFSLHASLIVYFIYCYLAQEKILPGEIGVSFTLGNPSEEWSRTYSPGRHWQLYPIKSYTIVPTEQRTINIPSFLVNAAKVGKKITRIRIPGNSAQVRIWNPWRYLAVVGESILADNGGLVKALQTAIRAEATSHTDEELLQDKDDLIIAAENKADELSEQWGVEVIDYAMPEIFPENERVSLAREQVGIEEIELKHEEIEAKFNSKMIAEYKTLGLSPIEAAALHSRERGKTDGQLQIIISGGNESDSGGIDKTVARVGTVLGATLGATIKRGLSDDTKEKDES